MQCAVVEIVPRDKLVCTGMVLFPFILQSGIYSSSIYLENIIIWLYIVFHLLKFFKFIFLSIFNIFRWTI